MNIRLDDVKELLEASLGLGRFRLGGDAGRTASGADEIEVEGIEIDWLAVVLRVTLPRYPP